VPDEENLVSLDWMADGSGFIAADQHGRAEARLLHVDRRGAADVLWSEPQLDLWGVASPDGRSVALLKGRGAASVWLVENP